MKTIVLRKLISYLVWKIHFKGWRRARISRQSFLVLSDPFLSYLSHLFHPLHPIPSLSLLLLPLSSFFLGLLCRFFSSFIGFCFLSGPPSSFLVFHFLPLLSASFLILFHPSHPVMSFTCPLLLPPILSPCPPLSFSLDIFHHLIWPQILCVEVGKSKIQAEITILPSPPPLVQAVWKLWPATGQFSTNCTSSQLQDSF